jgi:hypothetical protein
LRRRTYAPCRRYYCCQQFAQVLRPAENAGLRMTTHKQSFILGNGGVLGIPPPPWSIGIIDLGEHLRQNLGAQQLRGKILSRKDLAPDGRCLFTLLSLWR